MPRLLRMRAGVSKRFLRGFGRKAAANGAGKRRVAIAMESLRKRLDSREPGHYTASTNRDGRLPISGAQIAQLVEHATENRSVAGSIPALGTISPF